MEVLPKTLLDSSLFEELKSIFRVCSLKDRNRQPIREPSALGPKRCPKSQSLSDPHFGVPMNAGTAAWIPSMPLKCPISRSLKRGSSSCRACGIQSGKSHSKSRLLQRTKGLKRPVSSFWHSARKLYVQERGFRVRIISLSAQSHSNAPGIRSIFAEIDNEISTQKLIS